MLRILAILLLSISFSASAQHLSTQKPIKIHYYDSLKQSMMIDSLEQLYGRHKNIPNKYKLAILIALSHYPELSHTPIRFVETKIGTTLNARPTVGSLILKKKDKRKYVVRINNTKSEGMITIDEVPFNAAIGIFGHEFAHFLDYQNRNFGGVLERLWAYTSKKKKEAYEKQIDAITVERGLKWQMYDWAHFAMYDSDASDEYKDFKKEIYLEPEEILELND